MKTIAVVCGIAATVAAVSLPLAIYSQQRTTALLDEKLKTYRVEVHPPPPVCCPASAGVASCCHAGGGGGGGGGGGNGGDLTAQVNMVGFTNHGFGFMDYHNVRKGQKHFKDKRPTGLKGHGSTLQARIQHSLHRERLSIVQAHLKREEKQVDTLKGEVWALVSDVIPKMQKQLRKLRTKVHKESKNAKMQ